MLKIESVDNFKAYSEEENSANNFKKNVISNVNIVRWRTRTSVMYSHDFLKRAYQVINLKYDPKHYHLLVDRPQNMFSLRALHETEKLQMLQGVGNRIRTQHRDTWVTTVNMGTNSKS